MRHLQELYERFRHKGLVVLGFNSADKKQIALDFLRENGATFPCVLDSSHEAVMTGFVAYPETGVPTTYVIGRDGKIVDAWIGYEEDDPRVTRALERLGIE
jgi:peroxiredoxin